MKRYNCGLIIFSVTLKEYHEKILPRCCQALHNGTTTRLSLAPK